jgi:hypothetical protein
LEGEIKIKINSEKKNIKKKRLTTVGALEAPEGLVAGLEAAFEAA